MKELSSKNNPLFKHLSKLIALPSYRYECKTALISGTILIQELSLILPIKTLLFEQEIFLKAEKSFFCSAALLKALTKLPSVQGPVAEVPLPPFVNISSKERIAILDEINDPGNMGTLIRSAKAFGIDGVHITKGSCDPFNDKVIRSSKGAVFSLPISYEPYTELDFSSHRMLLADMKGTSCRKIEPFGPICVVLSNETSGLNPKWRGEKVSIPIAKEMESLNVAAAGAILFYEFSGVQC